MRLLCLLLAAAPLFAQDVHVRVSPGVTTGINGTTEFPTLQNAPDHHPFAPKGYRVVIAIEPGVYHERIDVTQNHLNITLLGNGPMRLRPGRRSSFCRRCFLPARITGTPRRQRQSCLRQRAGVRKFACALYAF